MITRRRALGQPASGMRNARQLKALCVAPSASLLDALSAIEKGGIELIFVSDKQARVLGTLSDGDIRRAILRGVPIAKPAMVARVMTREFTRVSPDAQRPEVLDLMRARGIAQIPVIDSKGTLVGLHLLRELIGTQPRPNAAVIMAGGQGMRLRPLTETVPKPMLHVAGRPILERLVLHLVGYGVTKIYIAVNYLGHLIEQYFKDGSDFGCRIEYLREEKALGTGGALSLLTKKPKEPLLVMNGDLLTQVRLDELLDFHARRGNAATICVRPYQVQVPFGVAEVAQGRIRELTEKPLQQMLINAGIYVLSPRLLNMIPRRQYFPITDLFNACLMKKLSLGAYVLHDEWTDIGRHDELKKARGVFNVAQ